MKADDILRQAADIIEDRGKLRDNEQGERSMARAVAAYTALRGPVMQSELDGWIFMCVLKLARATAGKPHLDDFSDLAGYAALAGECISPEKNETASPWETDKKPEWCFYPWGDTRPPEWAEWVAHDMSGEWWAYERRPKYNYAGDFWFSPQGQRARLSKPVDNQMGEGWRGILLKLDKEGRPCPASTSAT
jgi:hypothetical protein